MAIRIHERGENINPLPGARVQNVAGPAAFGAPVGQAVGVLGQVMKEKAEDLEDLETLEAFNRFKSDVDAYHNDPTNGVYNTRIGKDAEGIVGDADKWMDNKAFEYTKKLPSARAAENFNRMAQQAWSRQTEANRRYESKQMDSYKNAESQATIEAGINDIAANYTDDAAVAAAMENIMMALELQTRGLGDEAKKAAFQNIQSRIAMVRLGRMIEDDPFGAEEWYKANKDSFVGLDQAKAESAIKTAIEKQQAALERQASKEAQKIEQDRMYAITDSLWDQFGTDSQAAYEALFADPTIPREVKEKAWNKYKGRLADEVHFENEVERQFFEGWRDKIAESKSFEEAMDMIAFSGATGHERRQLEGYAAQMHSPGAFKEDIRDWHQAYREVEEGKLQSADDLIRRWGGILSDGSLKSLIRSFYKEQEDDGEGGGGGSGSGGKKNKSPSYDGFSWSNAVKQALKDLGIRDDDQNGIAMFTTELGNELFAREKKKGAPLSPVERMEALNDLTKQRIMEKGFVFNTTMPEYQVRMAERNGFKYVPGMGYVKETPDGRILKFDPNNPYATPTPPSATGSVGQPGASATASTSGSSAQAKETDVLEIYDLDLFESEVQKEQERLKKEGGAGQFQNMQDITNRFIQPYTQGNGIKISTYLKNIAERAGYKDSPNGFVRENADGEFVKFDPRNPYGDGIPVNALPPDPVEAVSTEESGSEGDFSPAWRSPPDVPPMWQNPEPKSGNDRREQETAPIEPQPEQPAAASGGALPGYRRMPDGTLIPPRGAKRGTSGNGNSSAQKKGGIAMNMVGNAKRVSSTFNDKRDGGKRTHKAIDVSAPEGSEIRSVDFGVPLKVDYRKTGKVPGNYVGLSGKTLDGRNMKVTIMHLQNHNGPLVGAIVSPGDLIGYVGNTGSTSTGAHMHLQIEIDGKRVDPEKYLASVNQGGYA